MKYVARSAFDSEMRRAIGGRLKQLRGGRSQGDFASELGVGQGALANYEAGRRVPSSKTLETYARLGDVSVPWILTGLDAGDSAAFDQRFRDLAEKLASYRDAGVFPKAVVSDDEMAVLKVLRGIRSDQATEVVRAILAFFDQAPAQQKKGYVARHAERLRKMVQAGRPPDAGVDFDALLEGFGIMEVAKQKRPPRRK